MRNEARNAALREQMGVKEYITHILEDPVAKATFMKQVGGWIGGWVDG